MSASASPGDFRGQGHEVTDKGRDQYVHLAPTQPRRAKPRGHVPSRPQSRNSMLPDLRFLNHNDPPPTASSILDSTSTNSANMQQFRALKEAEAWFTGTAAVLKERLEVCERLRDGLVETNRLLLTIEALKNAGAGRVADGGGFVGVVGAGWVGEMVIRNKMPVGGGCQEVVVYGSQSDGSEDAGERNDEIKSARLSPVDNTPVPIESHDKTKSLDMPTKLEKDADDDLKVMEEAVELWVKDIRVARAKWIAGGRDVEKRSGLR